MPPYRLCVIMATRPGCTVMRRTLTQADTAGMRVGFGARSRNVLLNQSIAGFDPIATSAKPPSPLCLS
jgi:hypothetical protein